ncbi:hypothetical protein LTR15_008046 [Elasticomyces elasticus]|nr:hypothetical protein LTR15_008046 [Elasticomyces elasticus]
MFLSSVSKRHTGLTAPGLGSTVSGSGQSKNIEHINSWILVDDDDDDDDASANHDHNDEPLCHTTSLSTWPTRQATECPRTEWDQHDVLNTPPETAICSKTTPDPEICVCGTSQARTEVKYQRQLLVRETVDATLDRLVELFWGPCNSYDSLDGLSSQLQSRRPMIATQLNTKQEGRVEIECLHDNIQQSLPSDQESSDTSITCVCPAIVEEYICRAGDASIANDRLAELHGRAAMQKTLATAMTGFADLDDQARQLKDARREALESDLHKALQEAESLRSQCLEQGYDPDEARYR